MLPIVYELTQDIIINNLFFKISNIQMIINTSTQEETMGARFIISLN